MKRILFGIITGIIALSCIATLTSCNKEDKAEENTKTEWPRVFVGDISVSNDAPVYSANNSTLAISKVEGKDNVLTITYNKVKFAENMPAMDVVVPEIPCQFNGNDITLSGNGIVPTTAAGIPVERFIATDLKGTVKDGAIEISVKFGTYLTVFTGSEEVSE